MGPIPSQPLDLVGSSDERASNTSKADSDIIVHMHDGGSCRELILGREKELPVKIERSCSDLEVLLMPSKSPIGSLIVKIPLVLSMVELEEGCTQLTLMLMEESGSLVCLERVAAKLISWDLSQIREESLALMEDVVVEPSRSTAALFEEYLEDLALESIALVSTAVIHSNWKKKFGLGDFDITSGPFIFISSVC